jgi:hypothetical protein
MAADEPKVCTIDGCEAPAFNARGWCRKHLPIILTMLGQSVPDELEDPE